MLLFRYNETIPFWPIVMVILLIAFLVPLPISLKEADYRTEKTIIAIFVSLLPSVGMAIFNIFIYYHLRKLQKSGTYDQNGQPNHQLINAKLKAKLTLMITVTFILSQITNWIVFFYRVNNSIC